jgi:hypothetical protein
MKSFEFLRKLRVVSIALCVTYLVFGAGAIFTGYKPTPFLWISAFLITLTLLALIGNRPTPPAQKQEPSSRNPEPDSGSHQEPRS